MGKAYTPNIKSDKGKNLTKYVAEFVRKNKYNKIPKNVVELAKKHIEENIGATSRIFEYEFICFSVSSGHRWPE